jgi:signal transduction histidine kinase
MADDGSEALRPFPTVSSASENRKLVGRWAAARTALARLLNRLAGLIQPDIDLTRQALERAALAEARLRAAVEALPEGVVFLDKDGRYILWNERYAEIYHRSADLFQPGRKLAETLAIGVDRGDYPEAVGREAEWIADRLAQMASPGHRHEQRLSDGRWILIEERRTSDGGLIGLRIDITELKETTERLRQALLQAEAANRAKSQFLSNMSHEIRTPLNGVLGLAHVLARTRLDAQQTKLVGTIIDSAVLLERLLSDVLDLSRIESGRLELRRESFSLERLVEEAAANFEPQAADKGLAFQVHIAPHAYGEVLGDPIRLRQVLGNLLSNAVKFTAEGGIQLKVWREDDEVAAFEVIDSGIGFERGESDRLFDRFVQADGSITRRYGGSGLGLSICRELVDMMGGQIGADAAPGQGARFWVRAPLPRSSARSRSEQSVSLDRDAG